MAQLSPKLLKNLRSVLAGLPFFSTDPALRVILVDERINVWLTDIQSAANIGQRVDLAIECFLSKKNDRDENGLVLLLNVLAEHTDKKDGNHRSLIQLSRDVHKELYPPPPEGPFGPPSAPIEFVNRDAEFREIRQEITLPRKCWVIDGPGGYGKTTFLSRIQDAYAKDGWLCVYMAIDPNKHSSIQSIAEQIAACIGHTIVDHGDGIQSLGAQIANGLLQHPVKQKGGKQPLQKCTRSGVALLIDNLEILSNPVFLDVADLVMAIDEGLGFAGFYDGKYNKLRIFLAGCDIRRRSNAFRSRNFLYEGVSLSPYTFHYIQETVQKYALLCNTTLSNSNIAQISARLMYVNGGHPGLTAHILTELKDSTFTNTNVWLARPPQQEFQHRMWYLKTAILDEFGKDIAEFLPILNTLSIFRKFGTWLLRELIQKGHLEWTGTEFELQTKLTNAYLLRREQGILQDSITQRLLSIKLRFEDEARFKDLCRIGMDLYKDRFCQNKTKTTHPQYWAVEHVYLTVLHAYYSLQLRNHQLSDLIIQTIKQDYLALEQNWDADLAQDFIDLLTDDWELEFFVNIFLSEPDYQPDHYQNIIASSI